MRLSVTRSEDAHAVPVPLSSLLQGGSSKSCWRTSHTLYHVVFKNTTYIHRISNMPIGSNQDSDIEDDRQRCIARNQEKFIELGLLQSLSAFEAAAKTGTQHKVRASRPEKKRLVSHIDQAPRRSSRIVASVIKDYNEDMASVSEDEQTLQVQVLGSFSG